MLLSGGSKLYAAPKQRATAAKPRRHSLVTLSQLGGSVSTAAAAAVQPEAIASSQQRRDIAAKAKGKAEAATAPSPPAAPAPVAKAPQERYDVYVHEPKPLSEGEEKHIISVFVADEAGLINRVAGVFGRRGANIESLAVGVTVDKALFTIVVTGGATSIANLVKQISKLVKVKYVEDITKVNRVEREMLLLKIRVKSGAERTEALQLAQIFRARVVDVSDETLTLCVSGDPGKCVAIQKTMFKFGILEVARTGRVCLKRGESLLEPIFYTTALREDAAPTPTSLPLSPLTTSESETDEIRADEIEADVYQVGTDADVGIWQVSVQDILDPTYSSAGLGDFEAHTLAIEVSDVPGVLNQVTGVFARRGYSIQSLAVGPSEHEGMSRICMVVPGNDEMIAKLFKQLSKLVYVRRMINLTRTPFVNRELMLVKVRCNTSQRGELRHLAHIFRADIIDVAPNTVTIEILGKEDKLKALTDLLEPYGILEIARTGRVAVIRESGVDNKFLERVMSTRVF